MTHAVRKPRPHVPPAWVKPGSLFFLTLCATRRGENTLCLPESAKQILTAVRYHHDVGNWFCAHVLLMPDHLHAIAAFPPSTVMSRWVRSFKIYTSRSSPSIAWQRDFFDHRLRNEAEVELKTEYIRQNPVRAGLVATAEAWPWRWSPGEAAGPLVPVNAEH